jgi:hypothetical protein
MQPPNTEPRKGRVFIGIAAASLVTGPTLVLFATVHQLVMEPQDHWQVDSLLAIMFYSSLFCLIGSIPAASLNAIVLGSSARKGIDAAWWAMGSGGMIGLVVAVVIFGLVADGRLDGKLALWFGATGVFMGALHWRIAVRPRRRWRLSLLRDEEAIRAME